MKPTGMINKEKEKKDTKLKKVLNEKGKSQRGHISMIVAVGTDEEMNGWIISSSR